MRYTYNIKVRAIVKFFVMRFDLATGTKPMFESELPAMNNNITYHSDEFGRLPVNKLVEPNRKTNKSGVILYVYPYKPHQQI